MVKRLLVCVFCLAVAVTGFAQSKVDERLTESTAVLKTILAKGDGIPKDVLNKSRCVLVYPGVKKVGVGIGVSYGRGVIVCRTGADMNGAWGAPAMYGLDTGSIGAQLGSSSTDYVLLVMSQRGADKVLSGKVKLGQEASAVAGPSGAQAAAFNDPNVDILSYSQAKGLFAGASLAMADLESDAKANKELYGKDVNAAQLVRNAKEPVPTAAKPLVDALVKASARWVVTTTGLLRTRPARSSAGAP
jgi:lipid-binding SYLF domain-containing protein